MGLFGNKKTDEEIYEEILSEYNIFEGIECEVQLPEKHLTNKYDGLSKSVASLTLGLVGYAATSGQKEVYRKFKTVFQVAEKGIILKNEGDRGSDLRIPYEEVVKAEIYEKQTFRVFIRLLKNQYILITLNLMTKPEFLRDHIIKTINERACGAQYEEAGWGLEHGTAEPTETKKESSSLMDELERLGNMYEKGLLTDEEFAAMKKKLIEGD